MERTGTSWPGARAPWRSVGEGEVLVDRADRGGSLADGGRHPLGRAGAEVADGEQPRLARLEGQRRAAQGLPPLVEVLVGSGPGR